MNAQRHKYYAPASPTRRVAPGRDMQHRANLTSLAKTQRTPRVVFQLDEDELPAPGADDSGYESDSDDSDEELEEKEEFEEVCMLRLPAGHVQQTYLSLSEAQNRRDIKYRREGFEMQEALENIQMIRAKLFA